MLFTSKTIKRKIKKKMENTDVLQMLPSIVNKWFCIASNIHHSWHLVVCMIVLNHVPALLLFLAWYSPNAIKIIYWGRDKDLHHTIYPISALLMVNKFVSTLKLVILKPILPLVIKYYKYLQCKTRSLWIWYKYT